MAYTEKEFNHYVAKPKQINSSLDEDLLLALADVNSSWISYMKPYTIEFAKAVTDIDISTFPHLDKTILTPYFVEDIIQRSPMMIQYVYEPSDTLIKMALELDYNVIAYLGVLSEDLYKWLVGINGLLLNKILPINQTAEIVEIAIRQNYKAYKQATVKNLELDRIVLEQDNNMVEFISDYHPELIDSILEYEPMFLDKFIGMEVLTDELIRSTILANSKVYRLIVDPDIALMQYTALIDLSLMKIMPYSDELIDYVITRNGLALEYIRKKDLFTIKEAVKENVLALQFVTDPRQHLIDYAFSLDGLAIQFIKNPTNQQYIDAVNDNGYAIEHVPVDIQTTNMQLRALSEGGTDVMPFIVAKSDEVTLEILRIEPAFIFSLDNPTDDMYKASFEADGQLIRFYNDWQNFFSSDVIVATLGGDGTLLEHIENKTTTMIIAAINNYPLSISWVENQTLEIAQLVIEIDPRLLYYIDRNVMDSDLLSLALSIDPDYFTRTEGELTWEQWQELILI